jgi:hypothetical protein
MLPTQKTPPKKSLKDLTVLLYAQSKFGKCLKGDTILIDPSGKPRTIKDAVAQRSGQVLTMGEASVLFPETPSSFHANPPDQLFRVTTETGRTIEATAKHPFLTRSGWMPLSQLQPGRRVAVVAEYPHQVGRGDISDELVKVMAYLSADDSLAGPSAVLTCQDTAAQIEFEAVMEALGDECLEVPDEEGGTCMVARAKAGGRSKVHDALQDLGFKSQWSSASALSEVVLGLRKTKLRLFLNRLFTCEAVIDGMRRILFGPTSPKKARQVQHLLARFGVVSLLRERRENGEPVGAELRIEGKEDLVRFIDEIGFFGEKAVRAEAIRSMLMHRAFQFPQKFQPDRLGPILFDRIVSIEQTTIAPVYDLTIEGTHNFVANEFIVHNSSFCAHAESALFLATEAGLNNLEVYQAPIGSWEDLLAACKEIAEGKHQFKTIIIDTVDNAYRMCAEHICQKNKIEHESDLGFGKGYALVNNEFFRVLNKLALLPYGLFLISHAQEKEIETRTGKLTRIVPTLPEKARKIVLGMVDMILFGDLETTKGEDGKPVHRRVLRTKPHVNYEAGDRTGQLPEVIELDFAKFLEAFSSQKGAAPTGANASAPSQQPAANQSQPNQAAPTSPGTPPASASSQQKPRPAAAAR